MLTHVQPTSLAAFHQTVSERDIQSKRLMGLYSSFGALSDREAGIRLGWAPAHVSARRDGLRKRGLVGSLGEKKNSGTGKTVNVYGEIKSTLF